MKNIIKALIFVLIFFIIFNYVFKILWLDDNPLKRFYKEPKDSLDVIYIGSSNAYVHFNTVLAWNRYGYTTGLLSHDSQSFASTKLLIEEAEKYQSPYVYVIDLALSINELDSFEEAQIRRTTDAMNFTNNRIQMINKLLSYINVTSINEKIGYYFSFLKYHNRWKNVNRESFLGRDDLFKGFYYCKFTNGIESHDSYVWKNNVTKIEEENKEVLLDLLEYIKLNNLNVLFVIPKRIFKDEDQYKLNDVINIIKDNNMEVINFNTLQDLNIDFSHDLYNAAHLNLYGSTKYTLYFSKYLETKYNLPDHREDSTYNSWNDEYNRFKQIYKSINNKEYDELLDSYDY